MSQSATTLRRRRPRLESGDWPLSLDGAAPTRRKRRSTGAADAGHENLWLWIVDWSLRGVVLVVPFLLGGRHPLGRLVLVALATSALTAWLGGVATRHVASRAWPRSLLLFAFGAALVIVQITPLSDFVVTRLSPASGQVLPLWKADGPLGAWSTLSLTPAATLAGLPMWLAYAALFFVTTQRVANLADVARLTRWLGVSAALMALFGLAQYFATNGSFFWCYEHPHSDTAQFVKGAFTNRNHFAHWMALGVGPLLAWLIASIGSREPAAWRGRAGALVPYLPAALGALAALVVAAALVSLSRGGALALMAAAAVVLTLSWRAGRLRGAIVAALLGAGVLVVAVLLAVNSMGRVADRLDDLSGGRAEDLDRLGARRAIWQANLAGLAQFPLFGAGIGSHREVYPLFLNGFGDYEFTHAENGYLQIGLESGIAGLALLGGALALVARWAWRAFRRDADTRWVAAPVLAVLAASAVHSLVDFVWYVPAAAAVAAIFAGCLWSLAHPQPRLGAERPAVEGTPSQAGSRPRWSFALGAAVALTWGLLAARSYLGPLRAERAWEQYLLLAEPEAASTDSDELDAAALALRLREHQQAEWAQANQAVALLEAAVAADQRHARAHLRLAAQLVRRFELAQRQAANSLGVFELRDAVQAARFGDRAATVAWLDRAIGPSWRDLERAGWHALQGLRRSPLSGEGYTLLAQVSFLLPEPLLDRAALLVQAARVRPYDGGVLFQLGREELLAGRPQAAMDLWRRSYASGPVHERRIIDLLAGRFPARVLLQEFDPQLATLRVLRHRCEALQRTEDLAAIAPRFAQAAARETPQLDGVEAARVWVEAHRMFRATQQLPSAYEAARRAVERDPHGLGPRMALAEDLLALGRFDEAAEAYRWCRARRPQDDRLARGLEAALRGGRG